MVALVNVIKVINMSKESYEKIMCLLDIIECELNKIASATGHKSFNEFIGSNN